MDEQSKPSEPQAPKKAGMGCGTLIAIFLIVLILVLIGSNAAVGHVLKKCGGEDLFDCLLDRLEDPAIDNTVKATGTYTFKDFSVQVIAHIPLEGGVVVGFVSGTCEGRMKGSFDGKNNGVISGKLVGACSPFVVNIPASAEFSGRVNKDGKIVPISFTGKGAGLTHKDSMSLSY